MIELRNILIGLILAAGMVLTGGSAQADERPSGPPPGPPPGPHPMMRDHRPYGGYCQGPQWGRYGARTPVRTKEDARRHLETFFEGQDISVGMITPRGRHFFADILDKDRKIVDRVIIDRRTGRIRSLY